MTTSRYTSSTCAPVFCSRCRQIPLTPGRTGGWCGPCLRRSKVERDAYKFMALSHQPWVVLDTETTGLVAGQDEIIDLAILSTDGTPLFSSLVRPLAHHVNGSRAQQIHHITDKELRRAPTFAEIWQRVENLFYPIQTVITYNAPFDRQMLEGNAQLAGIRMPSHLDWWYLMDAFAHWHGDVYTVWRKGYQTTAYRWQKLDAACQELEIETRHLPSAHRALGDAQRAHAVLLELASRLPERERRKLR